MARRGYSAETTETTYRVLMEVLTALGTYVERGDVVPVGGFVPYVLLKRFAREGGGPEHVGSSDVDLLLDFAVVRKDAYETIRKALRRAGFDVEVTDSPFAEAYGPSDAPVCHFTRGVVAGLGDTMFGSAEAEEVACGAVCRFVVSAT